jgi:hypothetical protein
MMEGVPYAVIQQRLEQEFGITVKSFDTLSRFWNDNAAAALVAKRQRAVALADEVATEAAKQPGRFDAATIDALKQKAFELAVTPGSDPRDVKQLYMLVLKSRDQDIDTAGLALQRKKFQRESCELFLKWFEDKRVSDIAGAKGLGSAEKVEQLGQLIFGEEW